MTVQPAQVAGRFYPADRDALAQMVCGFVGEAQPEETRALIAPHAGYIYSGPIAGTAYRRLARDVTRVLLLGPAHFCAVDGFASHSADTFETPLGTVPTERLDGVPVMDRPHRGEHSLEVHLPFLQVVLAEFTVCPILVGEASPAAVADLIERFGDGLVVVSSDLSHFHDYETARARDRATADAIEARDAARIGPRDACGCYPVGGLLEIARRRDWRIRTLDLRNSGDTQGPRGEVVGYGAFSAVS